MKKLAKELKVGDKVDIAGESTIIKSIEISDMGKQGSQKARIVAKKNSGETVTIIRPADYPMNCI